MPPTTTEPAAWTGYLRVPPGRWQAYCTAASFAACWDLLLAVRLDAMTTEKLVIESHRQVSETRPAKRR